MGRVLRCVTALLAALAMEASAQTDADLQRLLEGLTQGTEVTLITPLGDGTSEVTSFTPGVRLSAVEAATALERARQELAAFGVTRPTGRQLAAALVGGTVQVPTGSVQLAGVLGNSLHTRPIHSQLVASSTLPQVPATGTALSHAEVAQALQAATQQLARHGIANPTPEQIRVAMFGGTIVPPTGEIIVLPGVVASAPPAASSVIPPPRPTVVQPSARPVVPAR